MSTFNKELYKKLARDIFTIESPTGYTHHVIEYIQKLLSQWGYEPRLMGKGNLLLEVKGHDNSKSVATSAHVDTLGVMVRSINRDGTLSLTKLGGPIVSTLDSEYCTIVTRKGVRYTGTIMSTSPSVHVYKDADSKPRDIDNVVVRLDEKVHSAQDVRLLGIDNGDIVMYDPKFTWTEKDFLKSRFIDDKASVVLLLTLLKTWKDQQVKPAFRTLIYFVTYEEVGHGAATVDPSISEFVTLDMGCVGLDLSGNEYAVSIAAKDSGGPYDYQLTSRLIELAQTHKIQYVVDIFPFYGSDVGAAWRAGGDFKGALIGPGVHASHGMERTHVEAIQATYDLIELYLLNL